MYEPQSNLEEKENSSILKDDFSSKTDWSIFTSIAPELLDQSNKTSWVYPALKSTSHFLSQPIGSCRPDLNSEATSSCRHRSDAWSHLEYRVVPSTLITISQITSSGRLLMYSKKSVGPRMIFQEFSINWIFLWRLCIQSHSKPSITEKRRNKAQISDLKFHKT